MSQSPGKAVGVGEDGQLQRKLSWETENGGHQCPPIHCGSWEEQLGAVAVFRHYGSVLALSETGFAAFWALNSRWPEHLG